MRGRVEKHREMRFWFSRFWGIFVVYFVGGIALNKTLGCGGLKFLLHIDICMQNKRKQIKDINTLSLTGTLFCH